MSFVVSYLYVEDTFQFYIIRVLLADGSAGHNISYPHISYIAMSLTKKKDEEDTREKDDWYKSIKKSSLTPPSWVFGPVWTFLYILIIASFVIYVRTRKYTMYGILIYLAQAAFNLAWTPLFFGYRWICVSSIVLFSLNILVFFTYREFLRVSTIAGSLLIPYMVWILLALYLNIFICANN